MTREEVTDLRDLTTEGLEDVLQDVESSPCPRCALLGREILRRSRTADRHREVAAACREAAEAVVAEAVRTVDEARRALQQSRAALLQAQKRLIEAEDERR